MAKKLIVSFLILALAAAVAGTVTGPSGNYRITLLQNSVVKGTELKAGDYRLSVANETAKITNSKQSVEVPVKVETADQKFDNTAIRYTEQAGKVSITEIRIGGTKTRLVFQQ